MKSIWWLLGPLGLVLLSGCGLLVSRQVNDEVRDLSAKIDDLDHLHGVVYKLPPSPPATSGLSEPPPLERAVAASGTAQTTESSLDNATPLSPVLGGEGGKIGECRSRSRRARGRTSTGYVCAER